MMGLHQYRVPCDYFLLIAPLYCSKRAACSLQVTKDPPLYVLVHTKALGSLTTSVSWFYPAPFPEAGPTDHLVELWLLTPALLETFMTAVYNVPLCSLTILHDSPFCNSSFFSFSKDLLAYIQFILQST